jgi:hypothetical protein
MISQSCHPRIDRESQLRGRDRCRTRVAKRRARRKTYEIHADGGDIALCVSIVGESKEEAGLAHSRVTNEQILVEIVAARGTIVDNTTKRGDNKILSETDSVWDEGGGREGNNCIEALKMQSRRASDGNSLFRVHSDRSAGVATRRGKL